VERGIGAERADVSVAGAGAFLVVFSMRGVSKSGSGWGEAKHHMLI